MPIRHLLFLVETGVEQDEFGDAVVLGSSRFGLMCHLNGPGIGVHPKVAHADGPGAILLVFVRFDNRIVAFPGRNTIHQKRVFRECRV